MTKLELVTRAAEDQQHETDTQGICLYNDTVLTCGDDGKVKVWNHHDLKLETEFVAHDFSVSGILVLGDTLFTASADGTVKSWDANTYQSKNPSCGTHEEAIRALGTDGTYVYAGDESGEIRMYASDGTFKATHNMVEEVWSLLAVDNIIYSVRDRGVTISQIKEGSTKSSVMKSVEGRAPLVIVGDNLVCPDISGMNIIVMDNIKGSYKTKGLLKGHELIITAVAGAGQQVASTGWDNLVRLWDIPSLKEVASCEIPGCASALAFSPDGCIFVTGTGGYVCKLKVT